MEDTTLSIAEQRLQPIDGIPALGLEQIIVTDELSTRPTRAADFATENRILTDLMQVLAASNGDVLQRLVDDTLIACRAHSAGISLLQGSEFWWRAVAG